MVVARELAQGLLEPLLARIHVIVVPRANPDGAALGQPGTAQGTDLERDHLSLDHPRGAGARNPGARLPAAARARRA